MYFSPAILTTFVDFLHLDEDIIVYDCETTGLTPVKTGAEPECHIIQISAIRMAHNYMDGFCVLDEREWYIRPVETIPDKIVELTGITDEFLADKPAEAEIFGEIRDFFKDTAVVGYNNRRFDDLFMDEMYKRYGERFRPYLSLDMYPVSQTLVSPRDVKNYKLATIAAHFGLDGVMSHSTCGDVEAAMLLMERYAQTLMEREEKTGSMFPDYNAGVKMRVTGISRYERGKLRRIYVNTADPKVSFYMETCNLGWACKDKNMSTDRFNMPDMISQALRIAKVSSERELAQYK
ncbi:PolC-type DNA polymerase III [Otoolea muris]|uniref:3'-5' exonuclease n=1 Tax=Otoolea muris TaxID=2941515 RepID=UPI00203EC847|nr:3'-5' exonuclease [Otoolea muris]